MKNMIQLSFMGFILAILFSSCEKEDLRNEIMEETLPASDLLVINQLGFDKSTIIDMREHYLVEGDISIPKENIDGYKELLLKNDASITRQAYINAVISISNASDIKIKIDASLNAASNWRTAILNVMGYYNSIGSEIYMYEVSSNPDITISYASMNDAWGVGEFPTANGKPGKSIKIQNSNGANSLSLQQKVFLIAHEMGHNLGFRHTDYLTSYYPYPAEGNGSMGAHHVPGTPTGTVSNQDPNSVFNSSFFYNRNVIAWNGFSEYDKIAIQYVYPLQALGSRVRIMGDIITGQNKSTSYSLSYPSYCSNPSEITWKINGNVVPSIYLDHFDHIFAEKGTYTLSCSGELSIGNNILTFETEIEIKVLSYFSDNEWYVINKRAGNNSIVYDMVYKATVPFSYSNLHIILLFNGAYDSSDGYWDWVYNTQNNEYEPPTVSPNQGIFDGYYSSGAILKSGDLYIRTISSHAYNHSPSEIEMAIIYTHSTINNVGPTRTHSLCYFYEDME